MVNTTLIERAIESAKCRIYRVRANVGQSMMHQIKADNQAEIQQITIDALEKQIPKKLKQTKDGNLACECGLVIQVKNKINCLYYCHNCGQKIDW